MHPPPPPKAPQPRPLSGSMCIPNASACVRARARTRQCRAASPGAKRHYHHLSHTRAMLPLLWCRVLRCLAMVVGVVSRGTIACTSADSAPAPSRPLPCPGAGAEHVTTGVHGSSWGGYEHAGGAPSCSHLRWGGSTVAAAPARSNNTRQRGQAGRSCVARVAQRTGWVAATTATRRWCTKHGSNVRVRVRGITRGHTSARGCCC